MTSISFDNIYLLFLIIPLAVLFCVPFALAVRKSNLNSHNVASVILHVLMAVIIAFAAAGMRVTVTTTETYVYVLADVSYSASKNLDAIDGYIAEINDNLPENARLGVICFANGTPQRIAEPGKKIPSVKEALRQNGGSVDDAGTDILAALDFVAPLFKEGSSVIKWLVLITDGKQTTGATGVDLKKKINDLAVERKIRTDAIFIDDNLKDGEEVQVCSADYTQSVYTGSEQRAAITLRCNYGEEPDGDRVLTAKLNVNTVITDGDGGVVFEDSTTYFEQLSKGYNSINLKLNTQYEGVAEYSVEVVADDFTDANERNNSISFTQYVGGMGKTLLLTQSDEDYLAVRDMVGEDLLECPVYGDDFSQVPYTVERLCEYDRIILSNVNLDRMDNTQPFLESLSTVVSTFGKSLLTMGNVYAQEDDDKTLKTLADMMPIQYNQSEGGRLFTIVLDSSFSMHFVDKLEYAKRVALALVSILDDEDEVTLIKFDGEVTPLAVGSKLSTGREEIIRLIAEVELGQGTNINAAVAAAGERLQSNIYSDKRLMLISDGRNSGLLDRQELLDKIDEITAYDVQVTTFSVGPGEEGQQDHEGALLLQDIAKVGGGGFYDVSSKAKVEEVIAYDLSREQMPRPQGTRSYVNVKRSTDAVLNGIDAGVLSDSNVNNFTAGKIRASATTVLTVNTRKKSEAPLYAYWNFGNGKVASFAASVSGDQLKPWISGYTAQGAAKQVIYEPFFSNVMQYAQPEERTDYPFIFDVAVGEGFADIEITPYEVTAQDYATIRIYDSEGNEALLEDNSTQLVISDYKYHFIIPQKGNYTIEVAYTAGGETYMARKTLSVPFPAEYDSFAVFDEGVLQNAVGANGSVVADESLKIENDPDEIRQKTMSLSGILLAVCAVLFVVDIAVRKLKKEDIVSLFKGVKK